MLERGSHFGLHQAEQVAHLLNEHNRLRSRYTGWGILRSPALYLPFVHRGIVAGSIALQQVSFLLTEVKHLVVPPRLRGHGLGRLLVQEALPRVKTPIAYATIREGNRASEAVFARAGFRLVARAITGGHEVGLFIWEKQ